jgi:hypothetical protein
LLHQSWLVNRLQKVPLCKSSSRISKGIWRKRILVLNGKSDCNCCIYYYWLSHDHQDYTPGVSIILMIMAKPIIINATIAITFTIENQNSLSIMKFWFPDIPGFYWSALFLAVIFMINAMTVKGFGFPNVATPGVSIILMIMAKPIIINATIAITFTIENQNSGIWRKRILVLNGKSDCNCCIYYYWLSHDHQDYALLSSR